MNPVWRAAALAWRPRDLRSPWAWAEDNYYVPVSSMAGKWRSANSPWVKQLMEDFADNSVHQITTLCASQAAKTETMLVLLNWVISEDPGPTMWTTSTDEEALKFANERMMPSFQLCEPVRKQIPDDRTLAKSMEVMFPTMMMEIVGANSKVKLQSRSRRFLFLDEVRNWPSWALPLVLKRDRAWWNSRVVILTTPDLMDDTVHQEFKAGSQNHYHVPCASCGVKEELTFVNLKAEHPQTHQVCKWSEVPGVLDADKKWDFELLAPQIRYVCPACGHLHADHPTVRRRFAVEGKWVSHNPKAPPHHRSYTWSALLPPWVKWRKIVEEFILAQSALEFGNHEPLREFITGTLGQPWEDRLRFAKSENYIAERLSDFSGPFVEVRRFLSIDVQGKGGRHFYWSTHAFAQGGAQRVLAYGKSWSIEELRSIMVEWKVQPANVGIDSGHFTSEVYGYAMESGVLPNGDFAWKVFKGDRASHYLVDGVRMPFTYTWVDPYLGTTRQGQGRPIRQVLFSKTNILDRAETIMRGLGPKLELPKDDPMIHEYCNQLTAYERSEKPNSKGEIIVEWVQKRPDDHWGSCFRQALVAALATGVMDVK